MAELVNTDLVAAADRLASGSAEARAWVRDVSANAIAVDNEGPGLIGAARRAESIARKVRGAAGRRNCIGVFGPSQAGKSYLVSALARRPGQSLTADFRGDLRDFLREINPAGDRESTGLVTRFSAIGDTNADVQFPVSLRLLSETDIVKILANSFFSDFDQNNAKLKPADTAVVRTAIAAAEAKAAAAAVAAHLDEIDLFDLGEYFQKNFARQADALGVSGYWEALIELAPRLRLADRAQLYAVLWNGQEDFSRLFVRLAEGLDKLGHAPEARAETAALIPRELDRQPRSIIDVGILIQLNTPAGATDLLRVKPVDANRPRPPVEIPRALLAALIAEIRITMTQKPWDFFDHTDLLDFPGARSRLKLIDLPADPADRQKQMRELLLRGKIAYLFQRYTEERELTAMLLCMPPSVAEVKDLGPMVTGWIGLTHGSTPDARRKIDNALFLVLTKFDLEFIEKGGETAESRRGKWDRRLDASFLELYRAHGWPEDWDGKPFANAVFLRNPGMKQEHLMEYVEVVKLDDGSERLVEHGPASAKAGVIAEYRDAFMASAKCRSHFADMEQVWGAAFLPNDGGISFLVERLNRVLKPKLKARQIAERAVEEAAALDGRLRRFYLADDDGSRQKREQELIALRRTLYAAAKRLEFRNFMQLMVAFTLRTDEAREVLLDVAALKIAPPPIDEASAGDDGPSDDPWADPRAEARAGRGNAGTPDGAAEAPTRRVADRAAVFAQRIMNHWTERLRRLSQDEAAVRTLGIGARLIDELANEIIVGATRQRVAESIAAEVRQRIQSANARWDETSVAERAAVVATMTINDYVTYLGFAAMPEAERPGTPEPPKERRRAIFARHVPAPGRPSLDAEPLVLEEQYFLDWGVALRQLGLDNLGSSAGREISEEQNRRLGQILATIAISPLLAATLDAA